MAGMLRDYNDGGFVSETIALFNRIWIGMFADAIAGFHGAIQGANHLQVIGMPVKNYTIFTQWFDTLSFTAQ